MDKIRTSVAKLPVGWVKEVVIRKSGASAGKSDIYYYSPDGKKCRSKPQMLQYLPDEFDIDSFDFRTGKDTDSMVKKRKSRKEDFNFGKDFGISGNDAKPSRQLKKEMETIVPNIIKCEQIEETYKSVNNTEVKRTRADNLSHRCVKPKQLFWQRRLQQLKPVTLKTLEKSKTLPLDDIIRNLLPGSNNQALLNSIWYSLFIGNKVVGQHASLNALRKHPTALCNIDQPFSAPFTITDDMLHAQEKKVATIRKKLSEAQELLQALEDEDEDDLDDMEE